MWTSGGVYRAKALAAAPTASPAPPLREHVHILPAGQSITVPVYRRYIQVKDMEQADVELVQSFAEGLYMDLPGWTLGSMGSG